MSKIGFFIFSVFITSPVFATYELPLDFIKIEQRSVVHKLNDLVWVRSAAILNHKQKPSGTVFISPGRTESWINWYEYIQRLNENGYDVVLIEHRGQGRSLRYYKDKDVGHIEKFENYVDDFNLFVTEVKKTKPSKPFYAVGNSMGAAILLLSDTTPFERIVLNAPMFDIQSGPFPRSLAWFVVNAMDLMGFGDIYAWGTGPYEVQDFKKNLFAHSELRYNRDAQLNLNFHERIVGGPSMRWVKEAFRVPDLIQATVSSIKNPVLILQSEEEHFVNNQTQIDICKKIATCTLETISHSKHVLHLEDNENLNTILHKTTQFFKSNTR